MVTYNLTETDVTQVFTDEGSIIVNALGGVNTLTAQNYGDAELNGAAGDDSLSVDHTGIDLSAFASIRVAVYGFGGNDYTLSRLGAGVVADFDGGEGDDSFDVFIDNNGEFTILGGAGADLLSLVIDGDNTNFMAAHGIRSLSGDDGDDLIFLKGNYVTVSGGTGNDIIEQSKISGFFYGLGNTIDGGEGNDTIAAASDFFAMSYGETTVKGGSGDDVISLDGYGFKVSGGLGNDIIRSGGGMGDTQNISASVQSSIVLAEDGDDRIQGMFGYGSIDAGTGNDTIDILVGNETIHAGTGNDTVKIGIYSMGAIVYGEDGDDTIAVAVTGPSSTLDEYHKLMGGAGNDTYIIDELKLSIVEEAGQGVDWLKSAKINLSLASFANLENGELTGSLKLNLSGNSADNVLIGNLGANVISGGVGVDTLSGGTGKDVFDFNKVSESGVGFGDSDWIMDFVRGSDHIDLATIDASTKSAGNNAFKFIGTQGFHHKAGEVRFGQWNVDGSANDRTIIVGDVNGDGVADFRINLKGLVALSAGDFVL